MILITGITGRVGGAAARMLLESGEPLRALVRSTDKAAKFADAGAEIVGGDLENRDDVRRALEGVSRALLVTANSEKQATIEQAFAEEAANASVRHLVKISSMEASAAATAPIPRLHYESEQFIKSLGLDWTMLQPNFFMQNLLLYSASILNASRFALPLGQARTGIIDARDVGAVAATILRDGGYANQTCCLTGSELLTFAEVAERLSVVVGREIHYVDQPADEFRAFLSQFIPSQWHVDAVCALFAEIADRALEELSPSVSQILGRAPTTPEQFFRDHIGAFRDTESTEPE